eukprot:NODE_529_length_6421_cov_0.324739.p2 type:complete len:157 gc:universal NODE_529_length_6421_cov_0.324739:3534-3064(-)
MLVLGQGLKQSVGIFQYELTNAFDMENKAVFVDAVVLKDTNIEELYQRVKKFIEIATWKNFNIKWKKSKLLQSSIEFCGFKVDCTGYTCKLGYLIKLKGVKSPIDKRECQRLLGMLSWVRPFILNSEDVIHPIRQTCALKPFEWTEAAEDAYKLNY